MTFPAIDATTCVVRDTASQRGRHISVKPGTTAAQHLHYGRIVLEGESLSFSTEDRETALICLRGNASINEQFELGKYDALYIPRDTEVTITGNCDLAEVAAPVDRKHPLQFVRFADVQNDPALHFDAGGPSSQRTLNILIGKNVEAGRILAGVTFSKPGNWTSWPPHEHAQLAEEAYLYIDMPEPGWGLQLVRFADVQNDPALHFETGGPSSQRTLNILIGKNIEAGRILAGVTFSKPGNWTSWPPHEHAQLAEEAYLYIDMPEPGWGVQFVYNDPRNPELVAVVKQDDVVIMPQGYHPNVSAPGGTINFLWMMAANREDIDRQFGVVNVQPEYATGGSGLEASRK